MKLSRERYPKGLLVRAVWDCCHQLHCQLGRPPTRKEFINEMHLREPDRKGISTHLRQWGEWMRHHSFENEIVLSDHVIPDEYLEPQRLRVVYAVKNLGEVSASEVVKWIASSNAPLKKSEIEYQFQALTVNHNQRWFHRGSRKSMRSDTGHPMDKLYRKGTGGNTRYSIYASEKHGVWDIAENGKLPILIVAPRLADMIMLQLRNELTYNTYMDETYYDARIRMMRETVVREGQPAFRKNLFRAYEGRCAITGCSITELLEAAHLRPYAGVWHSRACFGVLLKTDIHTLFDKCLLWLDNDYRVCLSPAIIQSEYQELHGKTIFLPQSQEDWPLKEHMAWHRNFCIENNAVT